MSELEEPTPTGISRRTVTKAMAWAVPAIAIAAPVPAFAGASQGTITLTGDGCKLPGNSSAPYDTDGAVYLLTITNTTASDSTITITGITRTGSTPLPIAGASLVRISGDQGDCCRQLGTTVTAPANSVELYALVTGGWNNSANGTLAVSYNVNTDPQTPATTTPQSLDPMTPGGNNCLIGGSCSIANQAVKRCISKAVLVPNCGTAACVPLP